MLRVFLTVIRHRATAIDSIERTGQDLKERPESIEQMQRVFATLDRDQLATLLRRSR